MVDLVELRLVDQSGQLAALLSRHLGERAEDRARREHGGGDPDPVLRLADVLRDPVRERLAVVRAEPGPQFGVADANRARLDPAGVLDLAVVPSSSKLSVNGSASSGEATVRITFSCRVHESEVQFVEPLSTAAASRTAYLWCIRSGTPEIGRVSNGSDSIRSETDSGGGGTGIGPGWSML